MAADWRGWRLIVVGGVRFRWQCQFGCPCGCWSARRCNTGDVSNLVRVRSEESPSRLLTVRCEWGGLGFVLPGTLAEWVAHAQGHGWPNEQRTMKLALTSQPGEPEIALVG